MAFGLPQDQRGQMFAFITVLAVFGLYMQWDGNLGPISNPIAYRKFSAEADTLNQRIDSLQAIIDAARRDLQSGSVESLQRRVAEYSGMLELLRRLVPATHEVPALIDDISTKAKVRGVTLDLISAPAMDPGSPFDTHRYRIQVFGRYDQIGEFLADIASLTRIVVPQDIALRPADQQVQRFVGDTAGALLAGSFNIRTFVKSSNPGAARAPAARR
jgi:type IV pilus assembly protein PilO